MAAGITVFDLMHIDHQWAPVVGAGCVAVVLTGVGIAVRAGSGNLEEHAIPSPKTSLLNMMLGLVSYFKKLAHDIIGHDSEKYVPIIGSIFLFVLVSNFSGLLPGWAPPTDSLNTNLAMALFVVVLCLIEGLRSNGINFIKHFFMCLPPKGYNVFITLILAAVGLLVFILEMVSFLGVRPASLTYRLWGNMLGDHNLLGVVSMLVPLFLPIAAMALGTLVCIIQALVFSLLTSVYLKLSVAHDH